MRGDPFPKGGPSTATIVEVEGDSAFLRWVAAESHAEPSYVATMGSARDTNTSVLLRHWQVSTSEALFDIAAIEPPAVQLLDGGRDVVTQ